MNIKELDKFSSDFSNRINYLEQDFHTFSKIYPFETNTLTFLWFSDDYLKVFKEYFES